MVVVCAKYAVGSKLFFVIMMQVSMTTNKISPVQGLTVDFRKGFRVPVTLALTLDTGQGYTVVQMSSSTTCIPSLIKIA